MPPHYQIELTRDDRLDQMTVKVEARVNSASEEARNASAKELAHHIKSVIGVSTRVDVHEPGGVERSVGKARRVIDNRPKE